MFNLVMTVCGSSSRSQRLIQIRSDQAINRYYDQQKINVLIFWSTCLLPHSWCV